MSHLSWTGLPAPLGHGLPQPRKHQTTQSVHPGNQRVLCRLRQKRKAQIPKILRRRGPHDGLLLHGPGYPTPPWISCSNGLLLGLLCPLLSHQSWRHCATAILPTERLPPGPRYSNQKMWQIPGQHSPWSMATAYLHRPPTLLRTAVPTSRHPSTSPPTHTPTCRQPAPSARQNRCFGTVGQGE